MENGWVVVYSSNKLHLAKLAKALLEENQFECVLLDKRDSLYITLGEAEVFVRDRDVLKAKFILDRKEL